MIRFRMPRWGGLAGLFPLMVIGFLMPTRSAVGQEVGEVFRDCDVCPEMVVVPAGTFTMGSPESEEGRASFEGPPHRVTIVYTFAVGIYEVTADEWNACVSSGGCPGDGARYNRDGGGRMPVEVEWEPAWQYADWLSRITGHAYRLPSEAEWEYTARAGTRTARYWGESANAQCQYANGYDATAHSALDHDFLDMIGCRDRHVNEAPVGSFLPNPWGLYDVLGNLAEWADDCWSLFDDYAGAPVDGSPVFVGDCENRIVRGGAHGGEGEPDDLRSAARDFGLIGISNYGLRVVRAVR